MKVTGGMQLGFVWKLGRAHGGSCAPGGWLCCAGSFNKICSETTSVYAAQISADVSVYAEGQGRKMVFKDVPQHGPKSV